VVKTRPGHEALHATLRAGGVAGRVGFTPHRHRLSASVVPWNTVMS
jgi:hypothetical protein